jgi:signal transduction histidine kinase
MHRPGRFPTLAGTAVALALALVPRPGAAHPEPGPHSVVVLAQNEPSFPAFQQEMQGLRSVLERVPGGVVFHVEFLAGPRYGGPDLRERQVEWLETKYRSVRVDLVVAMGGEALAFALSNRGIWRDPPLVFLEVFLPQEIPDGARAATGFLMTVDAAGTIRLARELLPGTRSVAIVAGTTARERAACERSTATLRDTERLEVIDLCGLPLPEILARVASLPEGTVVFYLPLSVDGAGATYVPADVSARVAAAANRPTFSPHGTHLGRGVVGGVSIDHRSAGILAGNLARRILDGEDPAGIPVERPRLNQTAVDARALNRWGIPRSRVPSGALVEFDEPSLWQRYGQWITIGLAVLGAQTLVIGGLLMERRRRREAQQAAERAKDLEDQVARMNRASSLGELSGAIAHELGQPLTAITSNAHAAVALLGRGTASSPDVREILGDISLDAERAAQVLRRMRGYLRHETGDTRPVHLDAVAREAERLVRPSAREQEVAIRMETPPGMPPVMGDPVQLLQVALNLVANAMEAAGRGAPPRQVTIRTRRSGASVELSVEDSGPGIPAELADRVFQPFFTTRKNGLGMGLAICRTLVEAHGGRVWIACADPGRTELRVALPAADPADVASSPETRGA